MDEKRTKTVYFTGHREIPVLKAGLIKHRLRKTLEELIEQGYCYFEAGGALGFDTIAAQTVLDLQKRHPQVKLILVLPCLTQADRWSERDKEIYEDIKRKADKVVYTSQEYTRGCMHKRNRHLADGSSVCVCYLTEEKGGTAYTVDYARKHSLTIINIAG